MVAWLPLPPPEPGDSSRYLLTLSPKPRPLLQRLRERLGTRPTAGLQIQWPVEWPDRIRRVISRSGTRRRYIVPCFRYGECEAHGEAREEELSFILLDACDGVEFQEQPCRLIFEFRNQSCEHFPDILVATEGRTEFWECKRTREAEQFWIRKRAERLRALLEPLDMGYRVVTTAQLTSGAYVDNAKLLRRFAKHPITETVKLAATVQLHAAGQSTLGDLTQSLGSADAISDTHALIYGGCVCTDLSTRLDARSLLHLPQSDGRVPWVWHLFAPASA